MKPVWTLIDRFDVDEFGNNTSILEIVCIVSTNVFCPLSVSIYPVGPIDEYFDWNTHNIFMIGINNMYGKFARFEGNIEDAKVYAINVVLRPILVDIYANLRDFNHNLTVV